MVACRAPGSAVIPGEIVAEASSGTAISKML